jgi:squalene-hopene/tetraprenyl-beta-curcumene cyclase
MSALALANSPEGLPGHGSAVTRAADYLAHQGQADGSIYSETTRQYRVHSTAFSLWALLRLGRAEDLPFIRRGRAFLLSTQAWEDTTPDAPANGGFRSAPGHTPDLVTTHYVLEALYLSDFLDDAEGESNRQGRERSAQAYRRAQRFLERCQSLGPSAPADDEAEPGSFADAPAGCAPVGDLLPSPRTRTFLTCAGVTALLYARAPRHGPGVQAAMAYVRRACSTHENPGAGTAGLFTYLHALAQALSAWDGTSQEPHPEKPSQWRREVAERLLSLQDGQGGWSLATPEWAESRPEVATAYALLTLELTIAPSMPGP